MHSCFILSTLLGHTGGDNSAWARWNRGWTSEENRHGDTLNKLLYLSGCVDMRAVERSVQALIGTGFDPGLGSDPYNCFVYTSFQERATKISHHNTAKLADEAGAPQVAKMCRLIAVRPPSAAAAPQFTLHACMLAVVITVHLSPRAQQR